MKPLNSGHLRILKNLSVIERYPLLGGNLKKIVAFGTKRFVRYSRHVRYLGCPLLGGFTVLSIDTLRQCLKLYISNNNNNNNKKNSLIRIHIYVIFNIRTYVSFNIRPYFKKLTIGAFGHIYVVQRSYLSMLFVIIISSAYVFEIR